MGALLQEVLHEITAAPARFMVEFAQSLLLIGIIVWMGRRWVRKRLVERRERIAAELTAAEAAERQWAGVDEEVRAVVARAQQEAPDLVKAARERAESERVAAMARIESEAEQAVAQARQTVESEKLRVARETADRLTQLATATTRRYLDEMLTETERRALTQQAILASLEALAGAGAGARGDGEKA
jgi:F0F1-type ATP synthase membrane subunit b/b'